MMRGMIVNYYLLALCVLWCIDVYWSTDVRCGDVNVLLSMWVFFICCFKTGIDVMNIKFIPLYFLFFR
jgi:hypothetical protein